MPSSNPESIGTILEILWNMRPQSVLDVGTGYGKYGVLFREYLELAHGGRCHGPPASRRVRIDGVEAFGDYVGPIHRHTYDNMFIGDVVEVLPRLGEYDMIFLGDVLEHIDRHVAMTTLLPALVEKAKMGVLVSVPASVKEQDEVFGNKYEVHRSRWYKRDFVAIASSVAGGICGGHLIVLLSKNDRVVAKVPTLRNRVRRAYQGAMKAW